MDVPEHLICIHSCSDVQYCQCGSMLKGMADISFFKHFWQTVDAVAFWAPTPGIVR